MKKKIKIKQVTKYIKSEIKELKKYFFISMLIIIVSATIPFFMNFGIEQISLPIENLKQIAQSLDDKGFLYTAGFIFLNNLRTSFFLTVLGIIFFIPILINVMNGLIVGIILKEKISQGASPSIILSLLPHGIFELPAIFLATALGLRIGFNLFNNNYPKNKLLKNTFLSFSFTVVLLLIGAIIEAAAIVLIK